MARYSKQPDVYGCGPVAVMNALKWAGKNISISDKEQRRKYYKICNCVPLQGPPVRGWKEIARKDKDFIIGTMAHHMTSALYEIEKEGDMLSFPTHARSVTPIKEVERFASRENSAMILLYHHRDSGSGDVHGHYIFVPEVSKSGKTFTVVNNFYKGPAERKIRRKTLINMLKCNRKDSRGWAVFKP